MSYAHFVFSDGQLAVSRVSYPTALHMGEALKSAGNQVEIFRLQDEQMHLVWTSARKFSSHQEKVSLCY